MLKELQTMYGKYRMKIWYSEDNLAQVSVFDSSNAKSPLMWSKAMTKAQAKGARTLFEASGYFDIA